MFAVHFYLLLKNDFVRLALDEGLGGGENKGAFSPDNPLSNHEKKNSGQNLLVLTRILLGIDVAKRGYWKYTRFTRSLTEVRIS